MQQQTLRLRDLIENHEMAAPSSQEHCLQNGIRDGHKGDEMASRWSVLAVEPILYRTWMGSREFADGSNCPMGIAKVVVQSLCDRRCETRRQDDVKLLRKNVSRSGPKTSGRICRRHGRPPLNSLPRVQ